MQAHAPPDSPEVVFEWTQATLGNLPATAGLFSFRYQAMVNIAIFDAVSRKGGTRTPRRHQRDQQVTDSKAAVVPANPLETLELSLASSLATAHHIAKPHRLR